MSSRENQSSPELDHHVLRPFPPARRTARSAVRVHPTALVSDGAQLGVDVEIGPRAIVGPEVRLADGVRVGAGAILEGSVDVGEQTRIWPSAIIGCEPQDLHFDGSPSSVVIGPRCQIRELVTIHRASQPGGVTQIGADVMLMTSAHVAHDCTVGDRAILAGGALLAGHVRVGAQAFLSGNVVVHQFVRIGRLVMVGGASAVSHDVPPFALAVGRNDIRGLNSVGIRRAGIGPAAAAELRELFRLVRAAAPDLRAAAPALRARATTDEGRELVDFIDEPSRRGYSRIASGERR